MMEFLKDMPKINKFLFAIALLSIVVSYIGIEIFQDKELYLFFDNFHWTIVDISVALMIANSYFTKYRNNKTIFWFMIGFVSYAIGQIVWDIQILLSYEAFPAPSDIFYILLGPSIAIALYYELYYSKEKINFFMFWIDFFALSIAALTLVLASYLPRMNDADEFSVVVMIAYPIMLLLPMLILVLMIPSMRLRPNTPLTLFVVGMLVVIWSWLTWNSIALDGVAEDGSFLNIAFSLGVLTVGVSLSIWRLDSSKDATYSKYGEVFLKLLPLFNVLLSSIAIFIASFTELMFSHAKELVYVGAISVIILAVIRQSYVLQERDELLEIQDKLIKSANLINTIIQTVPMRIFWKDRDLKYLGCNDLFAKDAGCKNSKAMVGKDDFAMGWKDQAELYRADDTFVMDSGESRIGYEEPQTTPDGDKIWLRTSKVPLVDPTSGETIGILGMYDDITKAKNLEILLKESRDFLEESQRNAGIGSYSLDLKTMLWKSSDTLDEIFGIDHSTEKSFESWVAMIHPKDREKLLNYMENHVMQEHHKFDLEYRIVRQNDNKTRWVHGVGKLEFDEQKNPVKMLGTVQDVTGRKEYERQLQYIAHYDSLTGLPNRVLNADRIRQAMIQAHRRNEKMAILYLDLDGFKEVNDRYSHGIGDALLVALAQNMKTELREGDTLARLGGDEFVAILTDLKESQDALPIVQRVLSAVAREVEIETKILQVSASIGVTFYPQKEEVDADQLIRQADQAMYEAKQLGKNRFQLFDSENDRTVRSRHEHIDRIRQALENKELTLCYQPKINMRTNLIVGAEALLRWQHPEKGLVPPLEFLPYIENNSLSVNVGEWVIAEAISQMKRWKNLGLHIPVSVNVGARQLLHGNFVEQLGAILSEHADFNPNDLEIEILETSALEEMNKAHQIMQECKALGVEFALDDFGTGYSSLTYLKKLPVKTLKIDQSFVRDMLDDQDDLAILEGIVRLAKVFGCEVIAEGVETKRHGKELLALECELAQGYGIAKPMSPKDFELWAKEWQSTHEWRG